MMLTSTTGYGNGSIPGGGEIFGPCIVFVPTSIVSSSLAAEDNFYYSFLVAIRSYIVRNLGSC